MVLPLLIFIGCSQPSPESTPVSPPALSPGQETLETARAALEAQDYENAALQGDAAMEFLRAEKSDIALQAEAAEISAEGLAGQKRFSEALELLEQYQPDSPRVRELKELDAAQARAEARSKADEKFKQAQVELERGDYFEANKSALEARQGYESLGLDTEVMAVKAFEEKAQVGLKKARKEQAERARVVNIPAARRILKGSTRVAYGYYRHFDQAYPNWEDIPNAILIREEKGEEFLEAAHNGCVPAGELEALLTKIAADREQKEHHSETFTVVK